MHLGFRASIGVNHDACNGHVFGMNRTNMFFVAFRMCLPDMLFGEHSWAPWIHLFLIWRWRFCLHQLERQISRACGAGFQGLPEGGPEAPGGRLPWVPRDFCRLPTPPGGYREEPPGLLGARGGKVARSSREVPGRLPGDLGGSQQGAASLGRPKERLRAVRTFFGNLWQLFFRAVLAPHKGVLFFRCGIWVFECCLGTQF